MEGLGYFGEILLRRELLEAERLRELAEKADEKGVELATVIRGTTVRPKESTASARIFKKK